MTIGIIGRKCGMTRVFTEQGNSIPVTVIDASPNRITQVKTDDNDGYRALQVTIGSKRSNLVNKPASGHFAKAEVEAGEGLWELRLDAVIVDGGWPAFRDPRGWPHGGRRRGGQDSRVTGNGTRNPGLGTRN